MKNLFLSATAIATVMSFSAFAADLPSFKSATAAPAPLWTGFYAGLNAGYGFGTNNNAYASSWGPQGFTTDSDGPVTTMPLYGVGLSQSGIISNNQNGFISGFQTGYNYQFKDKFVVGLEADIQGTNISGSGNRLGAAVNTNSAIDGTATTIGGVQVSSGVDWLGTVRGRLGYLWNPSLMLFGTAGLTYGGVHANVTNQAFTAYEDIPPTSVAEGTHPFFGTSSKSQTLVGWNAGGGFEWMVSQNWSVKGEAIYWNLGNMNVATTSVAPLIGSANWGETRTPRSSIPAQAGAGNTAINYQGLIARAGINYHFDFSRATAVVAKF
jgi:outer membrane immunogenic protein